MTTLDRRHQPIAAVLLATFGVLGFIAAMHDSVTVDEFMIVPSGLARLQHPGEANWVNAFNPPLAQIAVALPGYAAGARLHQPLPPSRPIEYRWRLGHEFQSANRERYLGVFLGARLVSIVFGLITALIVFLWSRDLFGATGGLVSLVLACFSPNLLAHAHLATIDMGFTALILASSYLLWRWVRGGWQLRAGVAFAFVLSVALLTKFTTLFFLPLYAALALVPLRSERARSMSWRTIGLITILTIGAGLVTINTFYAWEDVGSTLGSMEFSSETFRSLGETAGWLPSPLPRWYVQGMDAEKARVEAKRNLFFYRGEVTPDAHPAYFIHAMLLKTPLSTIGLFILAGVLALRRPRRDFLHLWLPPLMLLAVFSLVIGSNLGLRYVLPIYPFLMIAAGVVATFGLEHRRAGAAVFVLLLCTVLSTSLTTPRFLSYFNLAAGGATGGAQVLSDSNLDWGQGLRDLRATMERLGIEQVYLSYFGLVDPALYGVAHRPLHELQPGGVVAISVHHLNGIGPFQRLPQPFVQQLRQREPLARAGDSIVLYQF